MDGCIYVTREMLSGSEHIYAEGGHLDFFSARGLADKKARERAEDPMLLAWFDRKAAKYSPDVICCDYDKPGWLIYAESRGGDITVDVNDEEYVFVYRSDTSLA